MGAQGFAHNPTALHEGGQQTKNLVDGSRYSGQLQSCKVPEDAWGLLGQVWFHGCYEELLEQLSSHLEKMNSGVQGAGQKMTDAAASLREVDERASKAISQVMKDHGSADLKVQGKDAPKSSDGYAPKNSIPMANKTIKGTSDMQKFLKDINQGATGAEITNDVTSVVSDGASQVADIGNFATDPLGWLIQKGLSAIIDVIKPLKDALEMVTGNGTAVNNAANNFNKLGQDLNGLAKEFERTVNHGFGESKGDAADAAQERLSQFRDGIVGTSGRSGDIASLLQFTSMLMQAAEDFIKGLITDVLEFILLSQAAGWALSLFTFGASEAIATAADVGRVAEKAYEAERKIDKVTDILTDVQKIWEKMGGKLFKENGAANKAFERMLGGAKHAKPNFATGLTGTVKHSVKKQAAGAAGAPNIDKPNSAQKIENFTGVFNKGTGVTKGVAEGSGGNNESDEDIERDLDL